MKAFTVIALAATVAKVMTMYMIASQCRAGTAADRLALITPSMLLRSALSCAVA
jgi:hypothetical protein